MYIYSTPSFDIKFKIKDAQPGEYFDLHEFSEIHVTFTQDNYVVDIQDPQIVEEDTVRVRLTQEQTAKFRVNRHVHIQGNFMTPTGDRVPSEIYEIESFDNLLKRIL